MAEAIALGASIIAIIQIADSVIGLCKFWLETVHDAPSDLRSILIETSMMKAVLENVDLIVSSSGGEPTILTRLSGPDGLLQNCQAIMAKMDALFPSGCNQGSNSTVSKRQKVKASLAYLAWPLKADKAKKLVEELNRVKMTIGLVLTVQSTQDIEEIKGKTRAIHTMLSDTQRDKIYEWLQVTDPTSLHHRARKQYEPQTGDWMLRSQQWTDWLCGTARCVWIHGIPGAGKTILTSHLIEAVKDHTKACSSKNYGTVYYYCSFTHKQDEAGPFLRWTINKLCRQAKSIPACLNELYKQGGTPSLEDLFDVLEAIVEGFDKIYLVIDAIDESVEPRSELLEVLRDLASDPRFEKIKLLATSREYVDIEQTMIPISIPVSMRNILLDQDIKFYVRSKLETNKRFRHWPQELIKEVLEVLSTKAKGMFRWVVCQIFTLERLKPEHDIVRNALENLPKTLDQTYERIFQGIPDEERLVVQSALKWIFYHQDTYEWDISTPILIGAIEQTMYEATASRHQYFLDEDRLRDLCGCLITVTPESSYYGGGISTVSFAHFTVWEFVSSPRILYSHASFFQVRDKTTRMEMTGIVIRVALAAGEDKPSTRGYDRFEMELDNSFDVFCALQSILSLQRLSQEISEQDDLINLAFDLLDDSKAHFIPLQETMSKTSFVLDSWHNSMVHDCCYRFLQIEWSSTSKRTNASLLAKLLLIDQTCALAKKLIEQCSKEDIFGTQLCVNKIYARTLDDMPYKFRGSIVELFASLLVEFEPFEFLLNIGEASFDPSKVLLSYLGVYDNYYACPNDILSKLLQLGTDVNCSKFVVSPLQIMTDCCDVGAMHILLEAGADPSYSGNSGGMRWEDGTLLFRFNGLVGLSPLDICQRRPNKYEKVMRELLLAYKFESPDHGYSSDADDREN